MNQTSAALQEFSDHKIWAILPETLAAMQARLTGGLDSDQIQAATPRQTQAGYGRKTIRKIMVIPIYGCIFPRKSILSMLFGASSCEEIAAQLDAAERDADVDGILLDVDSPGGVVSGVPELADKILSLRRKKPIMAAISNLGASAAYWLASAANRISVNKSGLVGSVGVFAEHSDYSKALEKLGIKPTLISAGKYKTEGNSYQPLTAEARAEIQRRVDDCYRMFVQSIAHGRDITVAKVEADFGQGRTLSATDAMVAGMVDSIEILPKAMSKFIDSIGRNQVEAMRREIEILGL